ncbi:NAD(P)/FAD-dependent oxidoreductase [Paenibacillus nasutitermitis]|uniref:FAD-dependent oxidoreductase n=1 Tax=Paenibacillus nasutitermitis TaxID=1652958 RepID=A0A916YRQ8_9BACL|nr:FAD-dependent oxidoreductase [Paenibacillus nasutitermitis]GGD57424.1 FAD-dependent oxidoreductase [Paenibacillus nasutitermitis]
MVDAVHDVIVLGGGVAGSSVALALAKKGWDTLLLDRQRFPRHKVCGEFLSPESQRMLHALGMREPLEQLGPSLIRRTRLIFNHGRQLEIPLPGTAIGISRYRLDTALHAGAVRAGVKLRTETTVTSVYPAGSGYVVEARQGKVCTSYYARIVIAAWGSNPRAGLPGHTEHPEGKRYLGVKSHFAGIKTEPVVELYFFPGGYLGLSPVEGGYMNVAALLEQGIFGQTGKSVLGMIQEAWGRNRHLFARLAHAEAVPGTQAAVSPVNLNRAVNAWDMLPQVGDATVMIPPLCGDGMSMALRSSELCAPLADSWLRGEISLQQWQHNYTQSIQREFQRPLWWGRRLQWIFGVPVLPQLMLGAARFTPRLAYGMVQATRIKDR